MAAAAQEVGHGIVASVAASHVQSLTKEQPEAAAAAAPPAPGAAAVPSSTQPGWGSTSASGRSSTAGPGDQGVQGRPAVQAQLEDVRRQLAELLPRVEALKQEKAQLEALLG